jgi:hypothetical protein
MYKAIRRIAYVSIYNQVAGIFRIGLNSRLWRVENAYTTYDVYFRNRYLRSVYVRQRPGKEEEEEEEEGAEEAAAAAIEPYVLFGEGFRTSY